MGSLRTLITYLLASVASVASAQSSLDLPREFANCAGRYSAMLDHAWLMQDPNAGEYDRMRTEFLALLDAIGGSDSTILNLRIEAKFAMSEILSQAAFGRTQETTERAARNVRSKIDACKLLLLGG